MKIEIASIGEADYASWDNFVATSANGTLFHKSYWLKASGRPFDLWGAYKSGNLVAGYVASRKSLLGRPMVAAPYLSAYAGLIMKKPEGSTVHRISFQQEAASAFARFLPEKYSWGISLFSPGIDYMLPFIWDNFTVRPWYTYVLDISDPDRVWAGIDGEWRREIKKAKAAGVHVVADVPFEKIVEVVNKSYERQGLRFRSEAAEPYFRELVEEEPVQVFFMRRRKRPRSVGRIRGLGRQKGLFHPPGLHRRAHLHGRFAPLQMGDDAVRIGGRHKRDGPGRDDASEAGGVSQALRRQADQPLRDQMG